MAESKKHKLPSVLVQMVDWVGGYSPELFTDDIKQYMCPACSAVLRNPILLKKCAHVYCDTCLRQLRLKHSYCLLCDKKIFPFDCTTETQIKKIVEELVVLCPVKSEDTSRCEWKGSVALLQQHLTTSHK